MDKVITLDEAVNLVPKTPFRLALGGVTLYRRPMAFALALLDRLEALEARRQLDLVCFTAGLESDILVGAGLVNQIRTCYFGLEIFGLAPNFTAAASKNELKIVDESETSLAAGLRAKLAGVGFMPSRSWLGTDMPKLRPDVRSVVDPYSGQALMAFPAIEVDVAVLHALEADPQGNAALGGNRGVDVELAMAAELVIVTADRVSPGLRTRRPGRSGRRLGGRSAQRRLANFLSSPLSHGRAGRPAIHRGCRDRRLPRSHPRLETSTCRCGDNNRLSHPGPKLVLTYVRMNVATDAEADRMKRGV